MQRQSDRPLKTYTGKKTFLELVKPVLYAASVVGIAPQSICRNRQGEYFVMSSFPAVLYSHGAILTIFCGYGFSIFYSYEHELMDVPNIVMRFSRLFLSAATYYSILHHHSDLTDVLNVEQSLIISLPLFYLAFPAGLFVIMGAIVVINQRILYSTLGAMINETIVDITPALPVLFVHFMYSCQIIVLHEAVEQLNENIAAISRSLKTSRSTSLRPIMLQHIFLRDICNKINKTYGFPMIMTNSDVCYEVTWCFYCLYLADQAPGALICISWAITQILPAFVAMVLSQRIESAINRTKAISNQFTLMTSDLPFDIREELREWEVQLRQLTMRFTANGFFDLNGEQIKTIVSTIITYTVIMVQTVGSQ